MPTALPDFVSEISGMLVALLPVAALGAMVLAGLRLRGEGGINYDAGGGFFKWLFWGALLLTLPAIFSATIPGLFTGGPAPIPPSGAGTGSFGSVATSITTGITSFVNNVLVGRIVPLMAAALYFKSILDSSEGHSPLLTSNPSLETIQAFDSIDIAIDKEFISLMHLPLRSSPALFRKTCLLGALDFASLN